MKPKIIHQLKSAGILSTIEEKPVWKDGTALGCLGAVAIGLLLPVCIAFSARTLREEPYQATGAEYVAAIHAAHPELNDLGPDHVQGAGSPSPAGAALRHPRPPQPAKPPAGGWQHAQATFYGAQYDRGTHHTKDGTIYNRNGDFVATRLVPLGTKLEIRYQGKTQLLTVRDTPAKRFGHRLDLPDGRWELFEKRRSRGVLNVEWRVSK